MKDEIKELIERIERGVIIAKVQNAQVQKLNEFVSGKENSTFFFNVHEESELELILKSLQQFVRAHCEHVFKDSGWRENFLEGFSLLEKCEVCGLTRKKDV